MESAVTGISRAKTRDQLKPVLENITEILRLLPWFEKVPIEKKLHIKKKKYRTFTLIDYQAQLFFCLTLVLLLAEKKNE